MEIVNTILFSAGLNIFNQSPLVWGVVCALCVLGAILALTIRCQVVYVDNEGDYEIGYEQKPWLSKAVIRPASKEGKVFVGWSLDPEGESMLAESELLLTHTVVLYAVWADENELAAANEKTEGIYVQLNYMDAETNGILSTTSLKVNTILPENQDVPVAVKGWSFEQGGDVVIEGTSLNAVFAINLYPIFDDSVKEGTAEFNGSSVVELLFTDSATGAFIYKESHYSDAQAPENYNANPSFVGWGVEPDGDAVIERGDNDAVFTIQLYSVNEEIEEATEEVYEEPVAEEVYEEPVAEEVVEEAPVEETVEEAAEEVVEEAPVEPVAEEVVAPAPTIVPTYIDNEGNVIEIKYSRSFAANLIQSDDTVKAYYSELKNHIHSYKGVKSKISWKFDSYNKGRDQLFKIKLRGKTICVYCALDPEEYDKSKYHHDAINAKIFAEVPMLLKIKSGLGLRKAKEIVDIVMAKFGIEKDPKAKTVDYVAEYPYAETEELLAKKLVKALEADAFTVVKSSKAKDEDDE
ncbi:MAG: hypothetical protein J6A96_05965 [Clostridia bacterium]|nr:hypothetical protein [Clostridia bacterium]